MNKLILVLVSAFGLMQTACEMKIASDNVVNAPNSSVFGAGSIPPFNPPPLQTGAVAPVTVGGLPNTTGIPVGTTAVGNGTTTTTPTGTIPMVPIKIASLPLTPALSDVQKSNVVRTGIQSTFANKSVSTFQLARSPSSIQAAPKPVAMKTASLAQPYVAREPKAEISQAVESAR